MGSNRSRWLALAGALALLLTLPAIAAAQENPYDENGAVPGSGEGWKVGYLSLDPTVPFSVTVSNSIKEQADIAGLDLFHCPGSATDVLVNLDCARQFAIQEVDGVINFNLIGPSAEEICAAYGDLPTVSIDIHQTCETIFFGASNYGAGLVAGQAIGEQMLANEDCAYDQVFTLESKAALAEVNDQRILGMVDGFEEFCGPIPEDQLRSMDIGGTVELAVEKFGPIPPTLEPGSTTVLLSLNDDMALGALSQFRLLDRGDEVRIAAQGADSSSWAEMACNPNWLADSLYLPERYGRSTVPAIIDILEGKDVPNPIHTQHTVVTGETIFDQYPETLELYPETADC